jgi:hypothetical protein
MSTAELEALADRYNIGGYADKIGNSDRNVIISQLRQRDRALEPDKPQLHNQTLNVGTMISSNIQQSTGDSNVSIHLNSADVQHLIEKIKDELPSIPTNDHQRSEIDRDLQTIELQLNSVKPRTAIVNEALRSMRSIFEGILAGLVANGMTAHLDRVQTVIHLLSKVV